MVLFCFNRFKRLDCPSFGAVGLYCQASAPQRTAHIQVTGDSGGESGRGGGGRWGSGWRRGTGAGNEEEWQGDESITILIVAAHTAALRPTLPW